MRISQVLRRKGTDVATVPATTTVREVLAELATRGIGALVVSGDGRTVEGIVSERDVARGLHQHGAEVLDRPVGELMTAEVVTCGPDASVHDLAQLMTDRRVRHVPVVDGGTAGGRLLGIVSIGDVVKARLDELEAERASLVDYIQTS